MKKNLLLITLSMIILSGCTLQEKMINENDPSLAKNLSGQKDPDQARFSLIKTDQAEAGKTVSGRIRKGIAFSSVGAIRNLDLEKQTAAKAGKI